MNKISTQHNTDNHLLIEQSKSSNSQHLEASSSEFNSAKLAKLLSLIANDIANAESSRSTKQDSGK